MAEKKSSILIRMTIVENQSNVKKSFFIYKNKILVRTAENKKALNAQILGLSKDLKENCFPRPGGKGCRCTEKDLNGHEIEKRYDNEEDCKVSSQKRQRRGNILGRQGQDNNQNVRDPLREKAQKNYAAVVQELKDKFRGLKEGCYPRPKGIFKILKDIRNIFFMICKIFTDDFY